MWLGNQTCNNIVARKPSNRALKTYTESFLHGSLEQVSCSTHILTKLNDQIPYRYLFVVKRVLSELHLYEVTSYKIHILDKFVKHQIMKFAWR